MKQIIPALSLLFIIQMNLTAQNLSAVDYQYQYAEPSASALFHDTIVVVGMDICNNRMTSFYNEQGHKLSTKEITADALYATDSLAYAVGYEFMDVMNHDKISLTIFNSQGIVDTVFVLPERNQPHTFGQLMRPATMDMDEQGKVLTTGSGVTGKTFTLKTDLNGVFHWYKEINIQSPVLENYIVNDSTYLFMAEKGMYTSDSSTVLKDSIFFNKLLDGFMHEDTVYALTNAQIIKISTSLDILDTIDLPEEVLNVYGFQQADNGFHLLDNVDDKTNVYHLSKNGDVVDKSDLTFPFIPQFFEISGEHIYFVSQTPSAQTGVTSFLLAENSELEYPDVSLTNVVITDVETIERTNSSDYEFFIGVTLTLFNRGTEIIDSLGIRMTELRTSSICDGYDITGTYDFFNELNIPPNDSVDVDISMTTEPYITLIDTIFPCFEVKAPNAEIEADTSNNKRCATFIFTDIPDISLSDQISIYPNPAENLIEVNLNAIKSKPVLLRIYNYNGVLLEKKTATKSAERINLRNYPPGIYFLKIPIDDQVITKKFVKQ